MEIAGIAGEITVFSDRAGESRPARNRRRVPDPGDLRRRSETGREAAQRCLDRADVLPSADRALVVAVFRDGVSVHRLALLDDAPEFGPEYRARLLRRRLREISARLLSAKFEFVVGFLEPADQTERRRLGLPCWPPKRRAVAQEVFINGRSSREAADALGLSIHAVRREMNAINALFEARGTR